MSKANGAIEKKDTFLQHVSLKNYKSIKDVEIDFKPGLNIIIGKNASGKTNFVNGLSAVLKSDTKRTIDSDSHITVWFKNDKVEIETVAVTQPAKRFSGEDYFNIGIYREPLLKINDKPTTIGYHNAMYTLSENGFNLKEVLIKYGVHYKETAAFINIPFSFVFFNNGHASSDWTQVITQDNWTQFVFSFFIRLQENIFKTYNGKSENSTIVEELKNKIISCSEECFKTINDSIFTYSPIQAIRLNPNFNIIIEEGSEKQTITNFYVEFLIDQSWLTFNLLSDGTKRLFYIISEMLSISFFYDEPALIKRLNIALLEEPELGIHPHQLYLLMQFIKEQSRYKQIIITTHSPQVLDTIGSDELDRIIICEYDGKNGTQLRHLTEKETNKAKNYMEDAFLSDYWRFSDLEPVS